MVATTLSMPLRAATVRLARQPAARHFRAMPVLRAQADKPAEQPQAEENKVAQRPMASSAALMTPFESFGMPSFGRMGQMFRELEEEMNQLSRSFGMPALTFDLPTASAGIPATAKALMCDVVDRGDHIEVSADVPGMSKEDIKVTVSPDKVLQISGERKYEKEEGEEGEGVWRVERSYGSFVRRFRLPENVNPEGIKAQVKDGVLRLSVPKTELAKPKPIEVQLEE